MSSTNNEIQVHKVQRFKQQKKKIQDQSQTKEEGSNTNSLITKIKCSNCGFQHQPRKCPAYGKNCNYCQKLGHFASMCRTRSKRIQQVEQESSDEESAAHSLNTIRISCIVTSRIQWFQQMQISGASIQFKIDTGADANILPIATMSKYKLKCTLTRTKDILKM